jgi:hypothetical protein
MPPVTGRCWERPNPWPTSGVIGIDCRLVPGTDEYNPLDYDNLTVNPVREL